MTIRDAIVAAFPDEEFIFFDDLDEAIIGVEERIGRPPVIAYSRAKAIDCLTKLLDDGDDEDAVERAVEWFDVNVAGAYINERTPVFITERNLLEVEDDLAAGIPTPTAAA